MAIWNPWRGCKKCSEGCLYCYIHKGDLKRGVDTGQIIQTQDFKKPLERLKNGSYKMKPGLVYTCFSSDFLLEEADPWRMDCWRMIKARPDCTFLPSSPSSTSASPRSPCLKGSILKNILMALSLWRQAANQTGRGGPWITPGRLI